MGVVAGVVLENQAEDGQQQQRHAADHEPHTEDDAEGEHSRGQGERQRPPAVRAEESDLPCCLLDLPVAAVLRTGADAPPGEQDVETDDG